MTIKRLWVKPKRLAICLAILAPMAALADSQDTFFITAGVTEQYDDNLFRLPSGVDLEPYIGRSSSTEFITNTSVMFNVKKAYSLQRFELQAGVSDHRYRNFDYLDFLAKPYKGIWYWSATPWLHGKLLTERSQTATSFTDYRGYNKSNILTQDRSAFDGEFDLGAAWHLIGGIARNKSEHAEQSQGEDDTQTDSVQFGLGYRFSSGNSINYIGRRARGEYVNRRDPIAISVTDNAFDDSEHAVSVHLGSDEKTIVDFRIASFSREHDHYAVRDFDGITGSADVNWRITEKSSLRAGVARQLASDQTFYSSYTETDRLTLAPSWQISQKTALSLRYDVERRDYKGAILPTSFNGRSDTTRSATVALDWAPLRDLVLNATLRRDERDSNVPGVDYVSNMYFVSAQISF